MKSEIDAFMKKEGFEAILVSGAGMHNPFMVYFMGGTYHLSRADIVKARNKPPIIFHNDMEREEAAKSGFETRSYNRYHYRDLLFKCNNNDLQATVLLYESILKDLKIESGKVAIFGEVDLGRGVAIFRDLASLFPKIEFVGSGRDNLLTDAMLIKEPHEIESVKKMGAITTRVVGNIADFLVNHKSQKGVLVKQDGAPLKIGEVRRRINLWLAEAGAETPEGTIFSIGRDAGIPHSMGNDQDLLELGKTIVFDIFPCQAGGGYCYDFTRSWCLGHASDEILQTYEQVLLVAQQIRRELKTDVPFYHYQSRTCDLFEAMGHPTPRSQPNTVDGYVHSIGHGVGLKVQEKPFCGVSTEMSDKLASNTIFTIEPGLYYPEKGFGIRIEDTFWAKPDGSFECLAEYPYDFILPIL